MPPGWPSVGRPEKLRADEGIDLLGDVASRWTARDQLGRPTCVGFAAATSIEVARTQPGTKPSELSAIFLYQRIRARCEAGAKLDSAELAAARAELETAKLEVIATKNELTQTKSDLARIQTESDRAQREQKDQLAKSDAAEQRLAAWIVDRTGYVTDLPYLQGATGLELLNLANVTIEEGAVQTIGGMTRLEHLNLWATNLSDESAAHLSELTNLRFLNVGYNPLSDAALLELSNMAVLEELHIQHLRIEGSGLGRINRSSFG